MSAPRTDMPDVRAIFAARFQANPDGVADVFVALAMSSLIGSASAEYVATYLGTPQHVESVDTTLTQAVASRVCCGLQRSDADTADTWLQFYLDRASLAEMCRVGARAWLEAKVAGGTGT